MFNFKKNQKDLIALEKFNSNNNVAVNLNFLEVENGMLLKRIDSKKAIWNNELNQWNLKNFLAQQHFYKYSQNLF